MGLRQALADDSQGWIRPKCQPPQVVVFLGGKSHAEPYSPSLMLQHRASSFLPTENPKPPVPSVRLEHPEVLEDGGPTHPHQCP